MNWEVWGPPIVVAAVGLVAGVILALRARTGTLAHGPANGLTRDDLVARKESLVEQLRGLEAERDKVRPEEFEPRWNLALDRAARALRDLDQHDLGPRDEDSVEVEVARTVEGRSFGRAGWAAAVVVFFVVLGLTLSQASKPRGAGGMTGATVDQRQAALEEAEARLQADPKDVDAAAMLAHAAIRGGDLEAGMRYVDAGRQAAPDDPRIQTSLAALMIAIGYLDKAQVILDQVLAAEPGLGQAWLWKGVLEMGRGDQAAASLAFRKVLELSDDAEDRRLAAAMLAEAQATPAAPTPARVKGRVELAAGVAPPPEGALVFIYARPAAEGRGPPLAALKVPASRLPLDFELGDADIVMQGNTWPEEVWLSARVDLDGNAMSREDGAPEAVAVGPIRSAEQVVGLTLQ